MIAQVRTTLTKASCFVLQRVAQLIPEARTEEAAMKKGKDQEMAARMARRHANDLLRAVERYRSKLAGLGIRDSLVDGLEPDP